MKIKNFLILCGMLISNSFFAMEEKSNSIFDDAFNRSDKPRAGSFGTGVQEREKSFIAHKINNPDIYVTVVVVHNNRLLLRQQVTQDRTSNIWQFPRGLMRKEDLSLQYSAKRITEEQVGLSALQLDKFKEYHKVDTRRTRVEGPDNFIEYAFVARDVVDPNFAYQNGFEWVTEDELATKEIFSKVVNPSKLKGIFSQYDRAQKALLGYMSVISNKDEEILLVKEKNETEWKLPSMLRLKGEQCSDFQVEQHLKKDLGVKALNLHSAGAVGEESIDEIQGADFVQYSIFTGHCITSWWDRLRGKSAKIQLPARYKTQKWFKQDDLPEQDRISGFQPHELQRVQDHAVDNPIDLSSSFGFPW